MQIDKKLLEAKKNFIVSLITFSKIRWPIDIPTRKEVEELAKTLLSTLPKDVSLEEYTEDLVKEAYYEIDSKMGLGVSLVDPEAKHDRKWVYKRTDIN
ncbi:hypothetical protein, partial [Klebsiella pneumoniae]|uniref:hypothetical protein n=1 Tax=Klebsiella pneumoniae TaxID=573 RepID=UPI0013A5494D